MEDFPSNSFISKKIVTEEKVIETPAESKPLKKVVECKVTTRKKTYGARFKELFVAGSDSFVDYIIEEVIVPAIKDMVINAVKQSASGFGEAIEQKLTGTVRARTTSRRTDGPVAYNRYSSTRPTASTVRGAQTRPIIRQSNRVEDILLESRRDGDAVIEQLEGVIGELGFCTVADFYDLVGVEPKTTDAEWGWNDFSQVRVVMTREGYLMKLPRPEPLS